MSLLLRGLASFPLSWSCESVAYLIALAVVLAAASAPLGERRLACFYCLVLLSPLPQQSILDSTFQVIFD
jgi:hypothetical protein